MGEISKKGIRKDNIVILLTGTVDPGHMVMTARNNPEVRKDDYERSIRKWAGTGYKLIFCENSNYDIRSIRNIKSRNTFEILQYEGLDYDKKLGKGYGEQLILKHVFRESNLIHNDSIIVKVAGRYFVRNIDAILHAVDDPTKVYVNLYRDLKNCDSRLFIAGRQFIEEYFFPVSPEINDSVDTSFEHILTKAVLTYLADGGGWSLLPKYPRFEGISGTTNEKITTWLYLKSMIRHIIKQKIQY
ncbi:MAG TPA: hypothetical protein VKA08_10770 [Balneolales bacterium]|nr:hypothetical protein [Balneolales bacterium]